jgi:thioredoxin reductase (NADPH)
MVDEVWDVLVVGGGPIGLHAGFKAGLLNLKAVVADKGRKWSRAYHVPKFHNIPCYPEGMSGKELINRLRKALMDFKDSVSLEDFVIIERIERDGVLFKSIGFHHPTKTPREYRSRTVILATGVVDTQPLVRGDIKAIFPYANEGLLHYCLLCDGNLVKGQSVAVLGSGQKAIRLVDNLLHFKPKGLTIITDGRKLLAGGPDRELSRYKELEGKLESEGVAVVEEKIAGVFGVEKGVFGLQFTDGRELSFDKAFSALGFYKMNNELAVQLGGALDSEGYILVDGDCRVLDEDGGAIPGLYAVGDINFNWNQVVIGFGDAERALIHAFTEYL